MRCIHSRSNGRAVDLARQLRGLILVLAGLPAAASLAQTSAQGTAQVVVERASFRATCSLSADVMASLLEGAEVEILESVDDWYRVRHPASGVEGCIHRTMLGPVTPLPDGEAEDELRERETAAREAAEREAAEREAAEREAELEAERERREAELAARQAEQERSAGEADRRARRNERLSGYLDLNFGYATPAEDGLSYGGPVTQGTPPAVIPGSRSESEYRYDRDLTYGVAGGFLRSLAARGGVGAGASVMRATYSVDLDLQVSRPHLSLPVIIVGDGIATPGPDRTETVLHLHVVYAPPTAERLRVRLFVGPSAFRSEVPVWNAVISTFPLNPPRMVIQRVEFRTQDETAVGGHAGADLAYFISDGFGLGVSAMFSRATHEISILTENPSEPLRTDLALGGLSAMFGVRFRF